MDDTKRIDGIGYFETEHRWNRGEVTVYRTLATNLKADMAMRMIERWGSVAGIPDGEDSAGRQKLRLQGVDEIVKYACDAADRCVEEFRARGWLLELPEPKEVKREKEPAA